MTLGRQVVVDVTSIASTWTIESGRFLGLVRGFLAREVPASEINDEGVARVSKAAAETDRVMKSARLACNDFELQVRIAEIEMHLAVFLELLTEPKASDVAGELARLNRTVEVGSAAIDGFNQAARAFMQRGLDRYSPRRSIRCKLAERRWYRAVAAEKDTQTRR
ncbi:hypothetical protein [Mycobacterium sp. shizuoka-1]|uniref:hypothetical protein n=1 Tax=Mycobacterium sp. shizuoka-1 TaxID=2039281 RepID=UPI000C063ECE|nr:hypothetical protein [Mycobacterium sp. shizuoka-1]GAY16238.1 hypothetical protein MSZK_29640 [Mycobacterium sp. shizuoka-1]